MNGETTQGMGCFAKGCLITLAAGFFLLVLFVGGAWYLYSKAVNRFTSAQPAQIEIETPTDAQFQAAEAALNRLREAIAKNRIETIEFTATDLNALIVRHPNFANMRGKARVGLGDSVMTIDLSAPLKGWRLPRLKERWFNGTARFTFDYVYGQFTVNPKSLIANGRSVPRAFFSERFTSSFNRSLSKSFQDSLGKNREGAAFWKNIKSMTVQGDKLVVVTEPGEMTKVHFMHSDFKLQTAD